MTFLRRPSLRRVSFRAIAELMVCLRMIWCLAWHLERHSLRVDSMNVIALGSDVKGGIGVEG